MVQVRDKFTEDNGLYITDILKLCSGIVMVTPFTAEDKPQEDDDLIYAGEYLDIGNSKDRLRKEAESQATNLSSLQAEI
jgi:hypothetical protein